MKLNVAVGLEKTTFFFYMSTCLCKARVCDFCFINHVYKACSQPTQLVTGTKKMTFFVSLCLIDRHNPSILVRQLYKKSCSQISLACCLGYRE
jgi:hypothetical protein